MPYELKKSGGKWVVRNKDTGDIKGRHSSKNKAAKQKRLLYMIKSGKKPTKNK